MDLSAMKAREQAATPGPWYTFGLPWFRDTAGVLAGSPDPHTGRVIADLDPMEFLDEPDRANPRQQEDAEFIAEARTDIRDLLAIIAPLEPYLHHDQPVNVLADVVKTIRESHERVPFITEDWHTERQDREYYQGLLAECAKTLVPLADHDPALHDLAGRLLLVVIPPDDLCEACGESENAHTFAELLDCCGGVDRLVEKINGVLEALREAP